MDDDARPIADGEAVLCQMLRASGVDPAAPSTVRATWDVFKRFMRVPFATVSDGVLYQVGTYDFHGTDEFYFDFLRQFEVLYADGEHDHFEQLHCEFRFPVTDETIGFGEFHQWWFADEGIAAWSRFIATVEARPEFVALQLRPASGASIRQEAV